jgi:hypothetical protein
MLLSRIDVNFDDTILGMILFVFYFTPDFNFQNSNKS